MSKSDKLFRIPFVGLKLGLHEYKFEINDAFFDDFEYSLIHKGKIDVNLLLEKKDRMLIAQFSCVGKVETECDRCNSEMNLDVKNSLQIIYTIGLETIDDESLIVLHPDEYEINVKTPIYELITLSLPNRKIHKLGECDEEMYQLMQKYTVNFTENDDDDEDKEDDDDDEDDSESTWSILKNLN